MPKWDSTWSSVILVSRSALDYQVPFAVTFVLASAASEVLKHRRVSRSVGENTSSGVTG